MTKGLDAFEQFAKKNESAISIGLNAVIYTRVSTKEQAENNMSLATQLKACEQYAQKNNHNVLAYFGGTYESAKTDERKEFKRMLDYLKRSREKINYIIVYSVDRFSRSGANAIYIASELKKQGILVQAVTQPADTNTASGRLQQNIHFIFSEYDNELRRDKALTGLKERISRGYWTGRPPIGYDSIRINGETKLVVNEKGKLIKKAFEWKAHEGLTDMQIVARLRKNGLQIIPQSLAWVFRNPFYCGVLVNKLLDGRVVEGLHEKLISKELFMEVNEIMNGNIHGYKHAKESEPHPLRRFIKCGECGTSFAGYIVKKKGLHYYKCAKTGCRCNKRAEEMHEIFLNYLDKYIINENYLEPLQTILEDNFYEMNENDVVESDGLEKQINEIQKKIDSFEERLGLGEISREIYEKFVPKYKEEQRQIESELQKSQIDTSNLTKYLKLALKVAANLKKIWKLGSYKEREVLQYLVFPEGVLFDRKFNKLRTRKVNSVFAAIASVEEYLGKAKNEKVGKNADFSSWVGTTGFEPVTPCL